MPLTLADVRDVVFSQPPVGERGFTRMKWTSSLILFTLS